MTLHGNRNLIELAGLSHDIYIYISHVCIIIICIIVISIIIITTIIIINRENVIVVERDIVILSFITIMPIVIKALNYLQSPLSLLRNSSAISSQLSKI